MTQQAVQGTKSNSSNAIIIVLVVLVVAALAGVGYLLFKPKDDASGSPEALPTSAPPVSTPAAAGTTVTHKSGTFSVVLPANGWQTKADGESGIAKGAPVIQFAPDLAAYNKGDGVVTGFAIVDLSDSSTSPKEYVAAAKVSNSTGCEFSARKVFEYKDFKGTFVERKPCSQPFSDGTTQGFDAIQLGVSRADGTKVGMVIRDAPGQTSTRMIALSALESIKQL